MSKTNKIFILKSNFLTPAVVIILLAIVAYLYFTKDSKTTLNTELSDFAVYDTSSITKIFLADKENKSVLLERKDDYWTVNGKFEARKDAIEVLLKTIFQLKVKEPVPKAAHNTVVKNMSAKSIKVEIYMGDEKVKTYYVGNATQNQTGTYMYLEGSIVPFVMHLERFSGYLTTRYFTDEILWKAPRVFNYHFNDIKSVTVQHFDDEKQSFKVYNDGNNHFKLEVLSEGKMIEDFDTVGVKFFIGQFKNLNYDQVLYNMPKRLVDSVLACNPTTVISVENTKGETKSIRAFRRKNSQGTDPQTGEEYSEYNLDNMYATIDDKELLLIQYFVFDPILKGLDYFIKK